MIDIEALLKEIEDYDLPGDPWGGASLIDSSSMSNEGVTLDRVKYAQQDAWF